MKGRFSKLVIPSLLLMNLSLTIHLMGETEASFSNQEAVDNMTFSAAFVFPSTIKEMEKETSQHVNEIAKMYKGYQKLNLDEALLLKETLISLEQELQSLHKELDGYYQQALKNPEEFNYVIKGFDRVEKLVVELDSPMKLSQLQSYIESLKEKSQAGPAKGVEEEGERIEPVKPAEPEAEVDQEVTGEVEPDAVVIETESEPNAETTIETSDLTIESNEEEGGESP
ncbi:DUF4047 domain-containing protein [Rossellomorea aquimaris]|nr:DUF4047 domain-containing protein [Rossellomorea aquimaris]WRP06209.1 DUF4047 domain-containing protein [Rossellomorea aquimaris]